MSRATTISTKSTAKLYDIQTRDTPVHRYFINR